MTLLILPALLLVLDLVAWRWGMTPATATTGDPDNRAGIGRMETGGRATCWSSGPGDRPGRSCRREQSILCDIGSIGWWGDPPCRIAR